MKLVSRLGVCAFFYSAAFAQARASTLTGCLSGGRDGFSLTVDSNNWYRLTGNTSGLARYVYKQISVEGKEDLSTQSRPGDTGRSFKVISFKAFETPKPSLSPSFSKSSMWQSETNPTYGIEFAHPDALSRVSGSESSALRANFVSDQNVATVARFSMPGDVYPNTNFASGLFAIFVNPEIRNSQSCSEFGDYVPRLRSSYRTGDVLYSTMNMASGSAGSADVYRYFHTFQNGLCYKLAFDFVEFSTGNYDLGCTIAVIREEDELNLIEPLLSRVAFVRPTIAHDGYEIGVNLAAARAFARVASCSRFFGGASVLSEQRNRVAMSAVSFTAAWNAASFALDGLLNPLIFRTNCSEAARISSGVTGGSKL